MRDACIQVLEPWPLFFVSPGARLTRLGRATYTPRVTDTDDLGNLRDAYADWLEGLREAGDLIRASRAPRTGLDLAEGHRYITRLATSALRMFVEHNDPLWPVLYRNSDETVKFGVDNPDNLYLRCALSGTETYRLWGKRGEAPYIGFTIGADFYGAAGKQGTLAQHHVDAFEVERNGDFQIVLSPHEHEGNWIPLEPAATGMIVRQTFFDRDTQSPAALRIDRVTNGVWPARGGRRATRAASDAASRSRDEPKGRDAAPPPLEPAKLAANLRRARMFVIGCTQMFLKMCDGWAANPHQLAGVAGKDTLHLHGDPDLYYASGYWRLADDEALVVEVRPAKRFVYWGFQLTNYWLESFDYRFLPNVATNNAKAARNGDGTWTLVVAHEDPGVPNWLTTAGHSEGAMCFRWLLAEDDPPVPELSVVKLRDVPSRR